MRPGSLGLDDRRLLGRGEPGARATPVVLEPVWACLPVAVQIPAQRPQGDIEQGCGDPTPQGPAEDILYCLFLSASRIVSMLPSSPKDSIHPTGKADSLNLAKTVNSNLQSHPGTAEAGFATGFRSPTPTGYRQDHASG
jgi:hypothetical protein